MYLDGALQGLDAQISPENGDAGYLSVEQHLSLATHIKNLLIIRNTN